MGAAHPRSAIDALLLFPHQLFASNPELAQGKTVYLIEDALYFSQYRFHKQKLLLHRASMQAHAAYLTESAAQVIYIDAADAGTMRTALQRLAPTLDAVHYIDPVDDWLRRRLLRAAAALGLTLIEHRTDMFLDELTTLELLLDKPRPSMARFYAAQRLRLGILVSSDGRPTGGKWSLDAENRKRLPAKIELPATPVATNDEFTDEACAYVAARFPDNPGNMSGTRYPVTHSDARRWLHEFLEQRFELFGVYEDAISATQGVLFHSVLTPMLNTGLLTPREVVDSVLAHAKNHAIPLNSLEGFLRQVIGWREFVRGIYELKGRSQRIGNYWSHHRPLPKAFWTASTGIAPIDTVIGRILDTGYAHHIERLMIMANFMLLCEFSPDDVYRWFMELFIDAYDWVMVPNVYGMGLHADGGRMMTKPYISSSSYILRMSDFARGPWCAVWDGLFWRFIAKHRTFFTANPRLGVMVRNLDRMDAAKLQSHMATAEAFLAQCV